MNKFLFGFIFVLAGLVLIGGVIAADVAYVVDGNLDNSEIAVRDFLVAEGYSVDVVDGNFNPNDYLLIVVSESVDSINFDNRNYRTLFMSRSAVKNAGIGTGSLVSNYVRKLIINRRDNYITEPYALDELTIYTTSDQMNNYVYPLESPFAPNSLRLAHKTGSGNSGRILLLAIDVGSQYNERNVYFGFPVANSWTSNAENLFRRSIDWLVASGNLCVDNDSDGYDNCDIGDPADDGLAIDCDDSDSSIYPNNPDDPLKDCINNAPSIDSFNPNLDDPKVIENLDRQFSVAISDVDNDLADLTVSWTLDGEDVGTGGTYVFKQPQGNYDLEVIVSDGELDTEKVWSVTVGSFGDFTCNQVGGNICSGDQVCEGSILEVIDTNSCCSISCVDKPLEFTDINNQCESKNTSIGINFDNIDSNEEFDIYDLINSRLKITNDLNEDLDFEVTEYFYDVTENKVIERKKDNIDIDDGKFQIKDFEFLVEEDLDENNNYAFFVVVKSENDECNQGYVNIDIKREDYLVILDSFDITGSSFVCGDTVRANINIKNIGTDDQNVAIKIKNANLKINEGIDQIEIQKYGGDDSVTKDITFKIPDDAEAGEYTLNAEVYYNGNDFHKLEKTITLQECKKSFIDEEQIDTIKLLGKVSEVSDETSKKPWYKMVSFYLLIIIIISVLGFLGYYYWDKKIFPNLKIFRGGV